MSWQLYRFFFNKLILCRLTEIARPGYLKSQNNQILFHRRVTEKFTTTTMLPYNSLIKGSNPYKVYSTALWGTWFYYFLQYLIHVLTFFFPWYITVILARQLMINVQNIQHVWIHRVEVKHKLEQTVPHLGPVIFLKLVDERFHDCLTFLWPSFNPLLTLIKGLHHVLLHNKIQMCLWNKQSSTLCI